MQTAMLVVHLMVAASLVTIVLFQQSEGGALGMGGGGGGGAGGFMSGRGTANLLTRITAFLALSFFLTSIALTILGNRSLAPPSVLEGLDPTAKTGPARAGGSAKAPAGSLKGGPLGGGILDALKQGKGGERLPKVPQGQ